MAPESSRMDPARWEERYVAGDLPWDTGEPEEHLRAFLEAWAPPPGPALEIGCGTGTNSLHLAGRGFAVTGVDLSVTAIRMAESKARAVGATCRFLRRDFLAEDVDGGPFALAYDRGCFHVFDDPDDQARFAGRVADHLAPEGLWHSLIGSTDGPPMDPGPPRRSAAAVAAAVEPRFEILQLRSISFDSGRPGEVRGWTLVARRRRR